MTSYIRWFEDLRLTDLALVGGKNASLGELCGALGPAGVRIPEGFAITADAYRALLEEQALGPRLGALLARLDPEDVDALARAGAEARRLVAGAPLPRGLEAEVRAAYRALGGRAERPPAVAVRSSATAEDLPEASFAGQHETYLGVRGEEALLDACRRCFASLFTDRAIVYRTHHGFDHLAVALSIGVQRMVRSDLGAAGVLFTLDPESGFRDVVLINAAYGLGDAVVAGRLDPDEFWIFKPTLATGHRALLRRRITEKPWKLAVGDDGMVREAPVAPDAASRASLTDDEALELARYGVAIEAHYGRPMDVEWAKDGEDGRLYILQARPETVHRAGRHSVLEVFSLRPGAAREPLVTGRAVGQRVGAGPAHRLRDARELASFRPGEVLVAAETDPDWEPIMKRAAGIVTDRGGRTCHAAIVSRELGVPCIVGTERGTEAIADGVEVTVSCAEGETGSVYRGRVPFDVRQVDLAALPRPATQVMLNVGNPDEAFRLAALPAAGVGLARIEFIIANTVKAHPMALLHPERVSDPAARDELARLTAGHADRGAYFVDRLAEGIAVIAAAFFPRDVIVRLSDFKTSEYAGLVGGRDFEPSEANPMLGFRGAFRYAHPRYREAFELECRAIRKVRDDLGLRNAKVMIPFCRTPEEGRRVLAEMARHGLRRGEDGLAVYVMAEIPSNVVLAEDFAALFDGFSIGSNDLTQLVLGVDRDSELVAPVFDERDPAVLRMIADLLAAARRTGTSVGICGEAPSDYPEFTRFLVGHGITSISLDPDALARGLETIAQAERELAAGGGVKSEATMFQRLEEFLRARQAVFELVTHRGAVTAQEQAASMHTSGWVTAKVVIVKERDGFAMAVLPAACVLDLGRMKGMIGHGDVRLATVDEIARAAPGCAPGAIPPFGALFGVPTFADARLVAARDITMPAGDFGTAIRMRAREYRRLARPHVGDLAVPESLVTAGAVWHERRPRRRAN
ncbi:MAG: phosphoenolpyruvate synthase [Candidatus Rokubacteria bacterium]|nr:phosphoenolpyruvate synthase [Candidatus Rokubacteria bacterium]